MSRALQPAQAPPPFPDPVFLSARRVAGEVLSQEEGEENVSQDTQPPKFEMRSSMAIAGNILLVDLPDKNKNDEEKTLAILLQRKMEITVFGTVRVGYALKRTAADNPKVSSDCVWEVKKAAEGSIYPYEMYEVTIEDNSILEPASTHESATIKDPKTQLAVLQMIASHDPQLLGHVNGTSLIAADQRFIYTISTYHGEGSLFEYCAAVGVLPENDARFFFRQILEGLSTLQQVRICHRNLSLESVYLRGTSCTIVNFSSALRIPTTDDNTDDDSHRYYMIQPQPPCGSHPNFVAPELLKADSPFDGFAVDLWSCGVMLMAMLLGSEFVFAAPVLEDPIYKEVCFDGNLKGCMERLLKKRHGKSADGSDLSGANFSLSDDAIDLMQRMLRQDPNSRLTLSEVKNHSWVVIKDGEDVTPPVVLLRSKTFDDVE